MAKKKHRNPKTNLDMLGRNPVAMAVETTGLEVGGGDELLAVAACTIDGQVVFDARFAPVHHDGGWPDAERFNGISPDDVAGCPPLSSVLPDLADALAQCSSFVVYSDLAMRAVCASGIALQRRPVVDVRDEYARVHGRWDKASRRRVPVTLASCAGHFGIDVPAKGDTLGRALCIARCLSALRDEMRSSETAADTIARETARAESERAYVSDILSDIYIRESVSDSGIFLIDAPTGAGKTWAEADAAARIVTDSFFDGRKVVCTAPQVKQLLDPADVEARIRAHGGTVRPHEVIVVKNRADMLADTAFSEAAAPPDGADSRLVAAFAMVARCAREYAVARDEVSEGIGKRSRTELKAAERYCEDTKAALDKAGKDFEKLAACILLEEARKLARSRAPEGAKLQDKAVAECREGLFAGKRWSWVGELFPTAHIPDARVIIATWPKFTLPVNTIVAGSGSMCDLDALDGAIVLADEGDECKSQVVDSIAQAAARNMVDMVELSRGLADSAEHRLLPSLARRSDDDEKGSRWQRYRRDMRADAAALHLAAPYKTAEDAGTGGGFLFNYDGVRVTSGGTSGFRCRYDADARTVVIDRGGDKGDGENLAKCVSTMRGMASYSQRMIAGRARIVLGKLNRGESERSREQALNSTLEVFGFRSGSAATDYMRAGARRVQRSIGFAGRGGRRYDADMSFYARGFSYTFLEDGDEHAMNTRLDTVAVQDSAEARLASVASHMRVFLISATMQVPSVLSNWNFGYLRSHDTAVDTIAGGDRHMLADAWRRQIASDREGVDLDIVPVDCGSDLKTVAEWRALWSSLLDDADAVDAVLDRIRGGMPFSDEPGGAVPYDMRRYYQVASVFAGFAARPDMRSCLCLMMSAPKGSGDWSVAVLRDVLAIVLCATTGCSMDDAGRSVAGLLVVISGSRTYDAQSAMMFDRLASGGSAFAIAAYGTMGTGIETQYPIPDDIGEDSLVRRNGPSGVRLKDFDCAYFGGIRMLLPKLKPGTAGKEDDFIVRNVNIAELMENGEISISQRHKLVKLLADVRVSNGADGGAVSRANGMLGKFDGVPSARGKAVRTLQQAFGRTNRAPYRLRTQVIWYDASLAECIDPDMVDMDLAHPAFASLIRDIAVRRNAESAADAAQHDNIASIKARNAAAFISRRLGSVAARGFWDEREMADWQELRIFLLEHGAVLDDLADAPAGMRRMISELWIDTGDAPRGRIWYRRGSGDYGAGTVVSLDGPDEGKGTRSVEDPAAARLDVISSVPELRALFERNGWALGWEPMRWIASPPVFTNIYLGAIGEVCVRELMQDRIPGLVLDDIADGAAFEKFDFEVSGQAGSYVDAKHWRASSRADLEAELRKIAGKMQLIGADKVVVANLFAPPDGAAYWPEVYPVLAGAGHVLVIPGLLDADGGRRYDWLDAVIRFLGIGGE